MDNIITTFFFIGETGQENWVAKNHTRHMKKKQLCNFDILCNFVLLKKINTKLGTADTILLQWYGTPYKFWTQ